MSGHLTAEQAIALIPAWPDAEVTIEATLNGLTNRSFRLTSGTDRFVLRLDAAHTPVLNPDRAAERIALTRAQAAGIGPEVIYSDIEQGILVTRYVAGKRLTPADLNSAPMLERIAALLRRLHALPPMATGFDIVAVARGYMAGLPDDPALRNVAEQLVRLIEAQQSGVPESFCHNDVIPANLIDADGETGGLVLIDWEYAGDNDAYFDLASLVAYHELASRQADILLSAYAGGAGAIDRERLDVQVRIFNALHWLWLASREAVTPAAAQRSTLERLQAGLLPRRSG